MSSEMTPVSVNLQVVAEEEEQFSTSTPNSPFSDRKNEGKADPKLCGVCGDKALGNNFNAITCESCKAFFRRNALRTKEFLCPFSNKCKVDAITRRFCQRCRLKKCFDIGMKKEWIMTEEEKKIKKQKIEQNRLKRTSFENSSASFQEEDSPPPAPKVRKGTQEDRVNAQSIGVQDAQAATPKQPMMEHNHNRSSLKKHNGLRGRNELLAITVTKLSSSDDISPVETIPFLVDPLKGKKEMCAETSPAELKSSPNSEDSSSNSSTNPPPLIHHPTKRHNMFNVPEVGLEVVATSIEDTTNDTPLLSSLIRHVQSPSEQAVSPVAAPPTIDSDENTSGMVTGMTPLTDIESASPSTANSPPVTPEQMPLECVNKQSLASPTSPVNREESNCSRLALYEEYMRSCLRRTERSNCCTEEKHELMSLPLNTMDSILSVAIAAEFNAFGLLGTNANSKEMNKAEQAKLNELLLASQALHAPVDAERPISVSETSDPSLINVINLTEIAIRRLIKMSKKISGFKNMCQEDQIALLKGGCTEMMVIRSVTTYDPDRDSWQIPHSNHGYNINLGVLKEASGNLYEEHQRFVKSFRSEWRTNENIMIILCAITLFTPERVNVVHKDVVKLEQDSYYYLLKRYLESIMNGCEAKSTYLQLIRKVAELRKLNSSHVRVFLEMNPKEVEPLLIEIFDLK